MVPNNDRDTCENPQRNKQKVYQKSIKNRPKINQKSSKIEVWRGPGRSCGGLGTFCAPGVPQMRPKTEKVTKSSLNPGSFPIFWGPQNRKFPTFVAFLLTFLWLFFGGVFWRPPVTNLRGFWDDFWIDVQWFL